MIFLQAACLLAFASLGKGKRLFVPGLSSFYCVENSLMSNSSQWQNLLKNLGSWQGSFTRLTPQGDLREDIPTVVTLEGLNQDETIRQTLQYFDDQQTLTQEKILEYSSLGRGVLFFEDGAFSQGSMQAAPFSDFGAEFGFIQGDRRLRLVQLFDQESALSGITLIREHRLGGSSHEQSPLTISQLLGTWQGEATTLYPDWRTPDTYSTTLTVRQQGDRLAQRLTTAQLDLASTARIEGSKLVFDQRLPIQVLLLPGGASANTPLAIPRGQPFFLEAGWLVEETLRQRMIRQYDAQGGWTSLTLVTERRVRDQG